MKTERLIRIENKLGLHARASAAFVQLASHFTAEVYLQKDGFRVNGKSIMGVMMLAAAKGTELMLLTEGNDASEAQESLSQLVANKFGEAE
ncbi:MAG: HPr family phosphocarrier protein [Zetaproteobacteria bacterium CG_4_9_14_3_um_filter_49_83]|nr:MAG: phosphocarrier protein HPr [Zetaproteobacteria bacterium CG1_02_49_23]PIQ34946.1 MAG: phosphocarrier protein HPr [Zetaproteobacteria bacterium CG17_big_fil_post_rev_8_21_14_2_50_50_13]PIV31445.1 MAG: HPr family phosphocarrier protein [Zetaproteobacteria bacterium CG02_land_8_20_14_3_00_50_9]PIY55032.1 MAG: HPr family phosphocarrier protein [Zetaproteobacteria bacterium CG_4_10_14_0_8_um_filter_49_80]PJA36517.1 MAG: HPr family phosphocarrier protein [Zetaproteobacteria bacterium CG_4_9_1